MKRLLFLSVLGLLLFCGKLSAQTFYQLKYKDLDGNSITGLMYYVDGQASNLRLSFEIDGDSYYSSHDYLTEKSDEGEEDSYMVMASEDDDTPILIWLWDESETEAMQLVPYICFDEDDEPEDWVRAESFFEVPLRELTRDYLENFFGDDDDELFEAICVAHEENIESEREIIRGLGDGIDIFRVLYTAVTEAKGIETDVDAVMAETRSELYGQTGQGTADNTNRNDSQGSGNNTLNTNPSKTNLQNSSAVCNVNDKPVMHLFLVANTQVADIGQACKVDFNNITNEMRGVAQSLGIRVKEYDVTGNNYSKSDLVKQLSALKPAENDIVFFLYTGHGFRFDDQKDEFPMMALTTNDYQPLEGNYVALSDVYDAICKKGARLNIVLSDCCNSQIGERRPLQGNTLFSRGNNNFSRKRLAELFFNAKGSILSTAASPGEYSWCDTAGGMFTLSFIQSLRKEISAMNNSSVSWQSVVDNTLKSALLRSSNNAEAQNGLKKMQVVKL